MVCISIYISFIFTTNAPRDQGICLFSMCTLLWCLLFSKYYNGIKSLTQEYVDFCEHLSNCVVSLMLSNGQRRQTIRNDAHRYTSS